MKYRIFTVLSLLFALFLMGFTAEAASDRVVRLRHIEGDVSIYPTDAQRPNEATINSPIYDGDVIETQNGRAELSFRNGVLVRLGDYSAAKIDSSYSPMIIELVQGSLFVDSHLVDSFREELKVRAGEAEIFLIDEGNMRVDLGEEGGVRITTIQGEAEVRASGQRVLLSSNERSYIDPGSSPTNPEVFDGDYDELDDWNSSRMDSLAYRDDYDQERYVDDSLYYDTYELEQYGDWRHYGTYGNVWVPRVYDGWRPYYDGRWSYSPGGWFWVSYEPWGWAPYHYGRWGWGIDLGWYWIPGYTFGPSWVSWYDYGDYIGWCPLNYYNRPIFVHNWKYYNPIQKPKTIDVGNSWTFVKKHDVGSASVKKISLAPNDVKKIRFDETKLIRTPKKELTSYVIPKTVKTPAYVNDKRIAPAKGPDVENPIGLKHRDDTFDRNDSKSVNSDRKEVNPGSSNKTWEKTRPSTTPKPVNPTTRPPSEPKSKSVDRDPGSSKSSDDRNTKSVTKSPAPTTNKNYNNNRSTSSSKYGSSDKKTSKPKPPNYMDRDSQYDRYKKETSRPYDTYRSPYIRRDEYDTRSKSYPSFRDPKSSNDDRRESEVSPRYYEGARKMYERFEERGRYETKSPSNQPRYEPKDQPRYEPKSSGNREYSRPSIQPRSSSSHKSSASRPSAPPRSKTVKKKD